MKYIYIINNKLRKVNQLLKNESLDPKPFIIYFTSKNSEFQFYSQNCSQLFIRKFFLNLNEEILSNYNKHKVQYSNDIIKEIIGYKPKGEEELNYKKFLNSNNIFPQSIPYSYFSGIIKIESKGKCNICGEIKKYSFMDFFDQHMYLDIINTPSTEFKTILKENLGYPINVRSFLPSCNRKILFEDVSKIVKLTEILVFTLERYIGGTNTISIKPNERIDVKDYVEKTMNFKGTIYELFAINIRFGQTTFSGHQICQIKKDNSWYTLNDNSINKSNINAYKQNSYALYYKLIN